MQELISIIVPIYNVEKYLNKCVDSILSQTYDNIEIILVDDGSPDNCGTICDHYASIDNRIKIIHKTNGGLSDARNAGIDVATGEYITFIDSDDYIDCTYIESLYSLLKKYDADMSICEFNIIDENNLLINKPINDNSEHFYNQEDAIKKLLKQKPYSNSISGKLFKTKDFKNIRFPVGKLYEDVLTTYKLFLKCNKIAFIACPLYYYVFRKGSITKSEFDTKQMDSVFNAEIMVNDIIKVYPQLSNAGKCRVIDAYIDTLKKISPIDNPKEYDFIMNKIKAVRSMVLFSKEATLKRRIFAFLSFFNKKIFLYIIKKI